MESLTTMADASSRNINFFSILDNFILFLVLGNGMSNLKLFGFILNFKVSIITEYFVNLKNTMDLVLLGFKRMQNARQDTSLDPGPFSSSYSLGLQGLLSGSNLSGITERR